MSDASRAYPQLPLVKDFLKRLARRFLEKTNRAFRVALLAGMSYNLAIDDHTSTDYE